MRSRGEAAPRDVDDVVFSGVVETSVDRASAVRFGTPSLE